MKNKYLGGEKEKYKNKEGKRKGVVAGSDNRYYNGCDYVGFGLCIDDTDGEC
ncbi:hypothetical protein C5S53_04455 [Methanophagales archaeon]|nr:hypothetical protein C5S53_04455 [Methanophagales archaeon]